MADTIRTESALLTIVDAEKVFRNEVPLRPKRTGQINAQDIRDIIVSMRSMQLVEKTGTYIATVNDDIIIATANSFTVTLYTAVGNIGRLLWSKNTGGGTLTLDGNSSETIDGDTTFSLGSNQSALIVSDNTNWLVLKYP